MVDILVLVVLWFLFAVISLGSIYNYTAMDESLWKVLAFLFAFAVTMIWLFVSLGLAVRLFDYSQSTIGNIF